MQKTIKINNLNIKESIINKSVYNTLNTKAKYKNHTGNY